jgi:transposase InsO family protein
MAFKRAAGDAAAMGQGWRANNSGELRSLPHARVALDAWRDDYNLHRPHSKLGWLTPSDDASAWARNEELEGRPSGAFDDDRIPVPAG